MTIQLTEELKAGIKRAIDGYEIYEVGRDDTMPLNYVQNLISQGEDAFMEVYDEWETYYALEAIHDVIKEYLLQRYEEKDVEEFIESNDYEYVRDIIWDTCTNDAVTELLGNTFVNLVYSVGDLYEDVENEAICSEKYGITDYYAIEEEHGEDVERTMRLGILLGYDIDTLYHSYFAEEKEERRLYRALHQVTINNFDTRDVCIAIRTRGDELLEMLRTFNNGDIITMKGGEYGYIDTYQGTGFMEQNEGEELLPIPLKVKYNRGNLSVDEYTGTYPYYDAVVGGEASEGEFIVVEKTNEVEETQLSGMAQSALVMEEWKKKYKETGCAGINCRNPNLHTTIYVNDFPAGWRCEKCGAFFYD